MPTGHSDLGRMFSEHPELGGRYVYFCPTREISAAARFTENGQIELLYDSSKHEYSRPILESLRNKLQVDGVNATYLELLEDAEGTDKLIRLLYTKPHCQGKCLANLWKMLHTPNPQKSNAGAPMPMQQPNLFEQEMKLSKLDFLALFAMENEQTQLIDIAEARGVAPLIQLPEPPPGIDCIGIPAELYKDYERMSNDMNMFKLPIHIKLQDGVYRDVRCTGHRLQEANSGGLCIVCREAKKAIDGFKGKLELRYCMGIPKIGWVEDMLKIRPIPNVEDHGDRYRHKKCLKRREGRSVAAECCNLCKLMKQRLRAAKRNRRVRIPKDPRKQRNWLLYTSPKYLAGLEMGEDRDKLKAEQTEEFEDDHELKKWQNTDESVRQRKLRALTKPMKPMYVRMTMQLMNPQCEWGDCQERFA